MSNSNNRLKIKKNVNKIESFLLSGLEQKVIAFNIKRLERENLKLQKLVSY